MLVRNRMSKKVVTVEPQETLAAARALLRRHQIRQLPVLRRQRLAGIVTDRDLRSASPAATVVGDVMTPRPSVITADAFVDDAARLLRRRKIGALPVVDGHRLVGILTASDVLDAFVDVSGVTESTYRIVLSGGAGKRAERQVRDLIHKHRGELKWLHRSSRAPAQLHLRLKAARIDDLVTALEAAGFEAAAVVAPVRR